MSAKRLACLGVWVACSVALLPAAGAQAKSPARCGPDDRPETALQGQVPMSDRSTGRSAEGYTCNLTEVGFMPSSSFANFDTYKNCAYYSDTIGATNAEGGTVVVDVSDPRKPVQTDYLTERAAANAGESLRVHPKRGLLVADRYYLAPGVSNFDDPDANRTLDIYDISKNCRKPKLLADVVMPSAIGHEGCFQADGMVYYMASTDTITPIDISDPRHPKQLSEPQDLGIHGCSTSANGKRAYLADIGVGRLAIADTSEVQARKKDAQIKVIGELPTPSNTGQQSTIPIFYHGHPYLLDWAEYAELARPCTSRPDRETNFGYPEIVDIGDERHPQVVAKIFNEVTLPENCSAVAGDSAAFPSNGLTKGDIFGVVGSRVFLYDSHYCSTDRTHDPTIAACASFGSGIRVYDIRDPRAAKEIAYFNPGTTDAPAGAIANATVARPVIRSDLRQIWFADIAKGFYTVQFRDGVWPFADQDPCPHKDVYLAQYDLNYRSCRAQRKQVVQLPGARACNTRRSLTVRLGRPPAGRIKRVAVRLAGKRVKVLRGRRVRRRFTIRRLPRSGRYRVRVVATSSTGSRFAKSRRYRACVPAAHRTPRSASQPAFLFAAGVDPQGILYYCRVLAARAAGSVS
ncbi:MAG: hypothetical protein QOI80_1528 [Solirubrobacteraceae bacterium]|nr:hypothetical protein [Solirubrobacteraceae bacterium]